LRCPGRFSVIVPTRPRTPTNKLSTIIPQQLAEPAPKTHRRA
jgi:hypothetical protein